MGWKDWSCWLKSAILFVIINLVLGMLLIFGGEGGLFILVILESIPALPFLLIHAGVFQTQSSAANENWWLLLYGTLGYFIIGAIIGLIIQKVKK